ncbi:MAG TPA: hypothetical protein DIT65_03415 [Cryomorphaceae bacterium]|nr:hypothetical protein [Cryomorphaceae bacterium]
MKHLLITVIICISAHQAHAILAVDVFSTGQDTLNVPMNLDSAYFHFSENSKSGLFEGYTIQIFSGDRSGANAVRANIISLGIESDARMIYREPNFKIHIGSFPDGSAAERALVEWRVHYPDAFVLKMLIPWYELPTQDNFVPSDTAHSEQ